MLVICRLFFMRPVPDKICRLQGLSCCHSREHRFDGEWFLLCLVHIAMVSRAQSEIRQHEANVKVLFADKTGAQRYLLGCASSICALACAGHTIVSAEAGKLGLIRLWDAASGQCQALLQGDAC